MHEYSVKLLDFFKLVSFNYILIIFMSAIAIIVSALVYNGIGKKLALCASIGCLVVTALLYVYSVFPILNDYHNESYVILNDVILISKTSAGFDSSGVREIQVVISNGDVVYLKSTNHFDKGEFKGKVVYSKQSHYLLEWQQFS